MTAHFILSQNGKSEKQFCLLKWSNFCRNQPTCTSLASRAFSLYLFGGRQTAEVGKNVEPIPGDVPDDIIEGAQGLGNPGARVRFVGPEEKTNLREGSSNSSNSFAKNKLIFSKALS